ncbi:hypothetical protein BJ165DRAFT_1489423 [Panaeolus papilionaceus]|nr:hypothetical protein BJ165DRAFT_1489423 [Panaeolus papilionaceus]
MSSFGKGCSLTLETAIFSQLHGALLRDPRNITIPILDWLEFGGLVFIVMPRWDLAWIHDFEKVSELIEISDVLFSYSASHNIMSESADYKTFLVSRFSPR